MDYANTPIDALVFLFNRRGYEYYCDGDEQKYHAVVDEKS
ncbi:MAG: hypothetical protein XXXJIFNMEKO3_01118 [Candidatus Erwinia impunctatus]|nr:hypothetical protein XXXJIFNMEKO_01118 [Culicoides impunctatus]